jgi:hypothetical protein
MGGAVDDDMANLIVAQLLYLDSEVHHPCIHSPFSCVMHHASTSMHESVEFCEAKILPRV